MAHHHSPSSGLDPSLVAALRQVVDQALADRASLRKNGHTTTEWLKQAVSIDKSTLQVIAAIVAAIWFFGGEWRDYQRTVADVQGVSARESTIIAQHADIQNKLTDAISMIEEQRMVNAAVERALAQMDSRIEAMPTRGEWQVLVRQQLVPLRERVDRMTPR